MHAGGDVDRIADRVSKWLGGHQSQAIRDSHIRDADPR
jgi:hypothetical protein